MMKKAGDILRNARLEKKFNIEDVCDGTKIRPSYIEALEGSNYSVFHSSTTVKGFIKNYSLFLGLNPENVIAIYRREQSYKTQEGKKRLKFSLPKLQITPTFFVIIFALLIVGSVISFFTYQYIQVSSPPKFEILEPLDLVTTTDDKVKVVVIPEHDKSFDLQINNKAITTIDDKGDYFTVVDLVEGQNQIVVTATNGYKKQTTKDIKVFRVKQNEIIVNKSLNISLKSVNSSPISISYKIDGGDQVNAQLTPGQTLNLMAKQKFDIYGPQNINNLIQLIINESRVNLLSNTQKQEITYENNQIKISAAP